MKILELTNYSAGICGVWQRARQEAEILSKTHEVKIFSSNFTKGSNKLAPLGENIGKIQIKRFPTKKLGGESFMYWFRKNAKKETIRFKPDIIIAHAYRHPHTTTVLKIAKKINAKIFLVTHAPFIENNETRNFTSKIAVKFYDKFIGPKTLKKFDKIITITKWELSYLKKLRVPSGKIVCIPNGIPREFFKLKIPTTEKNKILFLGRISPIKNLEILVEAISLIKNKTIKLEIVGPAEENYLKKLNSLIKELNLESRIKFSRPIYDLKEKIKKIDSAKIFVLPSKREAMPQSLIEAMAREKLVVTSDNPGSKEIVSNRKNGYLFKVGNSKDLAEKINLALSRDNIQMKKQIRKSVEKFSWNKLIKKLEIALNEK